MEVVQVKMNPRDKDLLQEKADEMRLALSSYCRLKLVETLNAEK
jgi:hypothetical protein